MKKNFKFRKTVTWVLLCTLLSGIVLPYVPEGGGIRAQAGEKERSYVVTMRDERALEAVCDTYDGLLDACPEENPETLTGEGVLVSDMTPSEAGRLESDGRVLSVEENVTLEGSGKKKCVSGAGHVDAGQDANWNLEAIHAANADDRTQGADVTQTADAAQNSAVAQKGSSAQNGKVKVAVLDSGVDMLDNIEVKERINLIPGQEDFTVMFEDEAGHGTAVAGIIAGERMPGETAEGVNKNVELYSAKVLDGNNRAPLSRIIEGIYWAIEKEVHIINMSFGTSRYCPALEDAVKAASDAGILIVAAAGNHGEDGTDTVEYPAAFPEVVAVGSVDARGGVSDFSARGEEVELAAPGEAVRVTGAFGADMVVSGTSMAAPHVAAVAALLWEKDLTKPAEFIRTLLDESARELVDGMESGYGLVDYAYAQKVYDKVEAQMAANAEVHVPENDAKVQVFDNHKDAKKLEQGVDDKDNGGVAGSWKWEQHRAYLEDKNINLPAMKAGAVYPDRPESGVKDMKIHPDFHGYFMRKNGEKVNYMAGYHFMIKIADAYGKGKDYTAASKTKGLADAGYKAIREGFKGMNKKIKSYSSVKDRKAFVYGIAMHTATDVFAHSTLKFSASKNKWVRITHEKIDGKPGEADNPNFKHRRFEMAYRVQRNNIYRFQGKRGDVPVLHDFHAHGDENGEYYGADPGNKRYRVIRLLDNAKAAGVTNKTVLRHFELINNSSYKE